MDQFDFVDMVGKIANLRHLKKSTIPNCHLWLILE